MSSGPSAPALPTSPPRPVRRWAPGRRLLLAMLLLTVAATAMVAVEGGLLVVAVAAAAFLLVALADFWPVAQRHAVGRAEVGPVFRLALQQPGKLELSLFWPHPQALEVALVAPLELGVEALVLRHGPSPDVAAPLRSVWPCLPTERGAYPVGPVRVRWNSPLGLWEAIATLPLTCEARVYPTLRGERQELASLLLRRSAEGANRLLQIGKGKEFEQLRAYQPGDDLHDLHWKATARRLAPVTKTYRIERTQEIYAVLDASRLAEAPTPLRSGRPEPMLEHYLRAAATLHLAAESQGDLFGLAAFSQSLDLLLPAKRGPAQQRLVREATFGLQPSTVAPDLGEVITQLRLRLRRRALLFFLTDLRDPAVAEQMIEQAPLLARQHLVLVASLRPAHVRPLFAGEPPATVEGAYEQLGGHLQWSALQQTRLRLRHAGIDLQWVDDARLAPAVVRRYLQVKARQSL